MKKLILIPFLLMCLVGISSASLDTRITRLETLIEQQDRALELQHREYERRLDDLNGEAARLRQMQETYVPQGEYEIAHQRLKQDVIDNTEFRNNLQGQMVATSAVVSAVFILLFKLFYWTNGKKKE